MVRIGIVGVGRMARKHHIPCLQQVDDTCIVATCDIREDRCIPGIPSYTDIREMLAKEELDVVYVLTPPGAHVEPVCLALSHGCHVFCEMPPALEPLDAIQMASFARETGCSLMFGTNRHFAPTYRGVKRITTSEPPKMTVLTKCRHGLHDLSDDFVGRLESHYAQCHTMEGTPMFLEITQFLDIAEWLNGPIIDCDADASALRTGLRTNTRTVAHLTHENGARSMLTYDEFGQQTCEHVTVHSSASTYIVRGSMMQPNELLVWASDGHKIFPAPVNPLERGGFLDQAKSFLRHVQKKTLIHPDGAQLARIIHLAREIDGSAWWKEVRVGMFG